MYLVSSLVSLKNMNYVSIEDFGLTNWHSDPTPVKNEINTGCVV